MIKKTEIPAAVIGDYDNSFWQIVIFLGVLNNLYYKPIIKTDILFNHLEILQTATKKAKMFDDLTQSLPSATSKNKILNLTRQKMTREDLESAIALNHPNIHGHAGKIVQEAAIAYLEILKKPVADYYYDKHGRCGKCGDRLTGMTTTCNPGCRTKNHCGGEI